MSERFSAQVVLIAGGTGGLGRAISAAFLEEGAIVVVTYRRQDEFEALRREVGPHAARLEGLTVDATNEAGVLQAVTAIVAKHGRLDVLTNTPSAATRLAASYGRWMRTFSIRCYPSTYFPVMCCLAPWFRSCLDRDTE